MSKLIVALKNLGKKITGKQISGETVDEVVNDIASKYSVVLVSPDKSVWDISIANDGTISGTKRS